MCLGIRDKLEFRESRIFSFFKSHNSPSDLNALLDATELDLQLLLPHQGAELRLIVKDVVIVTDLLDFRMVSGNGDVSHSYLAVMTAAQFYPLCRNVLNYHHIISLFRDAFEDDMVAFGFLNGKQLILLPILLDVPRVLVLADLAIKLLEIVLDGAADHLLLHLRLIPLLQTTEMDQPARTAAFTRTA